MNQDKTKRIWHGPFKGKPLADVPLWYLAWTYGSFPKQRNYIVGDLTRRGCTDGDLKRIKDKFPVLSKAPRRQTTEPSIAKEDE
jgi:hypothetical protein